MEIYLKIPEAIPSPWLREDSGGRLPIIPINLPCVPLKLLHDLRSDEVVHDPVPQWATPGLVCFVLTLKLPLNVVAFELNTKSNKLLV